MPKIFSALSGYVSLLQVQIALWMYRPGKLPACENPDFHPRSILLIQPFETVGDIVLMTPLIRELGVQFPEAKLTIVDNINGSSGLLDTNPHVDEILTVDINGPRWKRLLFFPWMFWRMGRTLRARKYDVAIVPRYYIDSYCTIFLAYYSGAQTRIAYSEKTRPLRAVLNRGFDRLLTDALPAMPAGSNDMSITLNLLSAFNKKPLKQKTEIYIREEDREFAVRVLGERGGIAICPTSGHSILKQWGGEKFAELAKSLLGRGYRIILVGTSTDEALATPIAESLQGNCINLVGKTTIRQLAAITAMCDLFIGNDAGPSHVASGMGTPTLTVFGSSCPHQFAPWGERNRVVTKPQPCNPCNQGHHIDRCKVCLYDEPKCMTDISIDDVQIVAEEMLASRESESL